ncbi:MAG TPA: hypothetical protein VD815_07435 [Candidatus Saccharimonadales bacterium]|nr:hypothetical protein [Candidatus Saccharimonadales bacterium]
MLLGIVLIVAVATSPSVTSAIPNRSNEHYANCLPTGNPTGNGGQEVQCCWLEKVPPRTGGYGNGDWEEYCSNCENVGTRGNINCTDPELQYREVGKPLPTLSDTINNAPVSDAPDSSNNNGNTNAGIGPKGELAGGIDDIQNDNNIIQSTPDSDADESTTVTTNTPQDQSPDVQTENTTESSLN